MVEEEVADFLGITDTARLAGDGKRHVESFKMLGQPFDLRAFSGTIPALDGNENAR